MVTVEGRTDPLLQKPHLLGLRLLKDSQTRISAIWDCGAGTWTGDGGWCGASCDVFWVGERDKPVARSEKCTISALLLVVTRGLGWVRGVTVMVLNAIHRARWAYIGHSVVVGMTRRTVSWETMASSALSWGHFVQINIRDWGKAVFCRTMGCLSFQ